MKHRLQPAIFLAAAIFAGSAALGQTSGNAPPPKPGADARQGGPGNETLSAEQLAKVKAVLAPYKADTLSVDDAKAIKRALRDAGMRPSRALGDALLAAGFSPHKLDALDPPPPRPAGEGEQPGGKPPRKAG